jgi:threonine aldolase
MYDYAEGAHPEILRALERTNLIQQFGYGEDEYCLAASEMIKKEIDFSNAEIQFVSGGTLANLIVISSALRPYESVIAAKTGHISIHEAGAIEYTGHKIHEVETDEGKIRIENIEEVLAMNTDEHCVIPKMVYISNATELGSIYTKNELKELHEFCVKNDLILYMDGARLGTALTSKMRDLGMSDLKDYVDVFYIGGTKNGALLGEAIVWFNESLRSNIRHSIKQKGGLLAKGRLLGIQFQELFRDGLFYKLATHANNMAELLYDGMRSKGYEFIVKPESNMIFPILSDKLIDKLHEKFLFYKWKQIDNESSIARLVTSWATEEKMIKFFLQCI